MSEQATPPDPPGMTAPLWLDHLDRALTRQIDHRQLLWRAAFALGIAGASLTVFVARVLDEGDGGHRVALLFGIMFSCAFYVIALRPVLQRFIVLRSPTRLMATNVRLRLPYRYCAFNPTAWALVLSALGLAFLPGGDGGWTPDVMDTPAAWARAADPYMLIVLAIATMVNEGGRTPAWWPNPSRVTTVVFAVLFVGGVVVLPLVSLAESLTHVEAGVAMLATAFIPCLFLSALHISRWVIWDSSVDELEALRFQAARETWNAAEIERAYFAHEARRVLGPMVAA